MSGRYGWVLLVCLVAFTAHAQDANNPYNSPIRNANPNSKQGTAPPFVPGRERLPQVQPRQPTVENGGIGNGNSLRPRLPTRPVGRATPSN